MHLNDILLFIKKEKIDSVYIRYNLCNYFFLDFVRKLFYLKITTILEFPTFPYSGELKRNFRYFEDYFFLRFLKKYIKIAVTYNDISSIAGMKAVRINNGIDLSSITPIGRIEFTDNLNLIAVANVSSWHGYDRII